MIANTASADATTPDPNGLNNESATMTAVATTVGATPTPTPSPTPKGSLADTGAAPWNGDVSSLMLLAAFASWIILLGGLAAETAWRRRPLQRGRRV